MRLGAPLQLVLLLACGDHAGARHTVSRNTLDMQNLPVPLPKHGLSIQTYGMGGYFDLEVVDRDAKTLRVIAENWDNQQGLRHQDKLLPLDATTVATLVDLSERAWREEPHGKMPQVTDVSQQLFLVDGDAAFRLHADLIEGDVRPRASALVAAVRKLATPALSLPLPLVPKQRHRHSIATASLTPPEMAAPLPQHGLVVRTWRHDVCTTIVLDTDRITLRVIGNGKDATREPDQRKASDTMDLAFAAWNEDAEAMQAATDVREDLYILDGDEAFYLSAHPISAEAGQTGRPAASLLMRAVYRLAEW